MQTTYDVVIVGAGGAGLSAGLMLARSRRRVLVLDGGDPRNAVAAHMHGVIGRDGWSPLELLRVGRAEVERYGGVIEQAMATDATPSEAGFDVTMSTGGRVHARRILVATGLRDTLPDIPGLAENWGSGVAHCPYCDGWEVQDRQIAVIASGPMSAHQAQLLRQLSSQVTYFVAGTELSADARLGLTARGIRVEERPVRRVNSLAGRITGLELGSGETVPADVVFVRPQPVSGDDLLTRLGADAIDAIDGRWVTVDGAGRTSVPGVWAAGNVVNPAATVPVAAAAGATAGAGINADLVEEEIRLAVARVS